MMQNTDVVIWISFMVKLLFLLSVRIILLSLIFYAFGLATSIWKLCFRHQFGKYAFDINLESMLYTFSVDIVFCISFLKTGPKEFIALFYGLQSWRVSWRLVIILANFICWCNSVKLNIYWFCFRVFLRDLIQTEVERLIPMSCEKHFWVWALQSHPWSWTCWCLSLTKVVGKARPLNMTIL